jgi:hypothetical protein
MAIEAHWFSYVFHASAWRRRSASLSLCSPDRWCSCRRRCRRSSSRPLLSSFFHRAFHLIELLLQLNPLGVPLRSAKTLPQPRHLFIEPPLAGRRIRIPTPFLRRARARRLRARAGADFGGGQQTEVGLLLKRPPSRFRYLPGQRRKLLLHHPRVRWRCVPLPGGLPVVWNGRRPSSSMIVAAIVRVVVEVRGDGEYSAASLHRGFEGREVRRPVGGSFYRMRSVCRSGGFECSREAAACPSHRA